MPFRRGIKYYHTQVVHMHCIGVSAEGGETSAPALRLEKLLTPNHDAGVLTTVCFIMVEPTDNN